jgi:hypothetical protein
MMSLREGKWVNGVFNPHVYELMSRLYSRHEYLGCADEYKWSVDSHVRDFRLPDLAIMVVDNSTPPILRDGANAAFVS